MARKYVEHWWLWVVVNAVSAGLYFWKGLYPTGVLFVIYAVVSVFGYYRWLREGDQGKM
jgi:nicotinamide mononucleotide transporter